MVDTAPAPQATASTAAAPAKMSLPTLTGMVVGSMVGAGVFSLPARFGVATGILGSLIAWAIAGTGILMLAFVFQNLAIRKPELDSGVFIYAKAGFGEDRKSTRLNSSHANISYAVFCLKKKKST